jgi:hypothetical protein
MRRYDDPVEVRRGRVPGPGTARADTRGSTRGEAPVEGPEQFLWQGRLWKVHAVLAQWVETGPWWHSSGAHAVLGADDWETADTSVGSVATELVTDREFWRIEASRGVRTDRGVFDLVFDWADGGWRLIRCLD